MKDLSFFSRGKLTVLAIPPSEYQGGQPGMFTRDDFDSLSSDVDFFSLMTYDYSNFQRPGPNAPYKWVRNVKVCLNESSQLSGLSSSYLL